MMKDKQFAQYLPYATLLIDQAGKLRWWNVAAEKLLQLTAEQIEVINLNQLLNIDIQQCLTRDEGKIEVIYQRHETMHLSLQFMPYEADGILVAMQDVTHLYHLERMRQDFIANVSHELRTPLTVVHGYLETLLDQVKKCYPNWQAIFEQMSQQTFRMERLVEDLLMLSRLETQAPQQEDFKMIEVTSLLSNIINDAKALSGIKQQQFIVDIDPHVTLHGIQDELRSAFSNLIFNAVHYTPSHGAITVQWHQKADKKILSVKDTGIGIAKEHLPRLTERFYRVDRGRSRASGGTGLGLAIVKHVLTRHHAELHVESNLGEGSDFQCVFD